MGRLIRVGGGVTRGGQWESGPHEWAGAGPTTSTLVAVPPVADPLGPPSTSTVGDVFPALTPPHHLAGYNHDRPEGRRGGLRRNLNNNTRSHGTMSSGTGGGGGRGKEARLSGAPVHCPIGPAAAASQPLSRRNAQRGNPNTKVRMDGRAAFPCDCGPTREGMHTAHPTRVSARIKGTDGPQSQGGRKSRRSSDRLKFRGGGGGGQQHAKRGNLFRRSTPTTVSPRPSPCSRRNPGASSCSQQNMPTPSRRIANFGSPRHVSISPSPFPLVAAHMSACVRRLICSGLELPPIQFGGWEIFSEEATVTFVGSRLFSIARSLIPLCPSSVTAGWAWFP